MLLAMDWSNFDTYMWTVLKQNQGSDWHSTGRIPILGDYDSLTDVILAMVKPQEINGLWYVHHVIFTDIECLIIKYFPIPIKAAI